MNDRIIQNDFSTCTKKDLKKSNLEILTKENDLLLKSLKRPGSSHIYKNSISRLKY